MTIEGLPEIPVGAQRMAYDFCEDVREAAELMDLSNKLREAARRKASKIIVESMFTTETPMLEITVIEGTQAFVSKDDEIVEENPRTFIAHEVRSIGERGVEFHNSSTGEWLKIQGFDFEVAPVFPDDQSD